MTDPALFLAFVGAVAVLMLIPGPNVALIVANSVAHGPRAGLTTVAGTASAMVLQLATAALGLNQMLGVLGHWFEVLRWGGVLYLVGLGLRQWVATPVDLTATRPQPGSPQTLFARAFLVSLTNPKTLIFYGAFLPQFIARAHPAGPQLALLCPTFLAIAIALDSGWALAAGRLRGLLAKRGRLRNRLAGGALIGAGAALAAARAR